MFMLHSQKIFIIAKLKITMFIERFLCLVVFLNSFAFYSNN